MDYLKYIVMGAALIATPLIVAPAALAQATTAMPSEADNQALLLKAQNYLNSIGTMQARFAQTAGDGSIATGTFYLRRPGRLRFEYDPPIGDYIVADKTFIHYWDDELKEHNNAPIGMTLADFILRKNITLSGEVTVRDMAHLPNDKLRITVYQTDDPAAGKLALLFNKSPMQLEKWRVTDATGAMTEIALTDIQTGMPLDAKLFVFKAPKGYEPVWEDR